MKTHLVTIVGTILITAGFAAAEASVGTQTNFPYFQLGSLIVAGLIITGMKFKYDQMKNYEAIGAVALYAFMVSLFTNPVIMAIKDIVG